MTEEIQAPETILYGEFSSIFKEDGKWTLREHKLPDGTVWTCSEPDAIITVQRNRLRVRTEPLRRFHDTNQQIDNSKHVYSSTTKFQAPEKGIISFELQMRASVTGAKSEDLYNGFTTFALFDQEGGFGLGFLTNGLEYATIYARQIPPSIASRNPAYPRLFEIYDEHPLASAREGSQSFTITYDKQQNRADWLIDGENANYQDAIPDPINSFSVELGLMTGVELGPDGSRSLQGQGITGEWSAVKITRAGNLSK